MRAGSRKIEPELVGQRLTLRLHDPAGGYRDLVGILESATSIRKRNGEVVTFNPDEIAIVHVVKEIVDRAGKGAPLSLRIAELEELSSLTWPALRTSELGNWKIRISHGITYRANSVLVTGPPPHGDPGTPLDEAIANVENIYSAAGLPAVFHLPLPLHQELHDHLLGRGWSEMVRASFLIADLIDLKEFAPMLSERDIECLNDANPTDDFLALHCDQGLKEIMQSYPARYVALRSNGEIVATARVAISETWAILTRLFVAENQRRNGLAELLMLAAMKISNEEGATKIALQLDQRNAAAQALYEKLGFREHHTYTFIEKVNKVGH